MFDIVRLIKPSIGIITRILVLCVAINFWGCVVAYNPQYRPVSELDVNKDFETFVSHQTETVNSFKGREIKEFMLQNPIKFEERTAVPDGLGGYLYTVRVRPTQSATKRALPRIAEAEINQYGSVRATLEHTDVVYNLFVNSDGILEDVKVDFRVYDTEVTAEQSAQERKVIQDNANARLVATTVVTLGLLVLIAALRDTNSDRRY